MDIPLQVIDNGGQPRLCQLLTCCNEKVSPDAPATDYVAAPIEAVTVGNVEVSARADERRMDMQSKDALELRPRKDGA